MEIGVDHINVISLILNVILVILTAIDDAISYWGGSRIL